MSWVTAASPVPSSPAPGPSSGTGSPARQRPALHDSPLPQVPHDPTQPSSPHCLFVQDGVQVDGSWQWPVPLHFIGGWHAPQTPLHPSSPHSLPVHTGVQTWGARHCPAWHSVPVVQVPHTPPQPLSPHSLPVHAGVHPSVAHNPAAVQVFPVVQLPQVPVQPSGPHCLPVHCGVQVPPVQVPDWQVWPPVQDPHDPPQPSSPQSLLPQFGVQVPHWPPQVPHASTHVLSHWLSQQYASPAQTQASQAHPLQPPLADGVHPSPPLPGTHVPYWHVSPLPQDPQDPPQPSLPHTLRLQSGVHGMMEGQSSEFTMSRVPHE